MRVLQIQNESAIAQSVELMLKAESFNVYTTDEGEEGIELARLYDYDVIVLSSAPDRSDIDQVRAIRAAKVKSAILVLSADCAIETCVKALGAGADDFMTRPFHKDEFVARLIATARRSKGHPQSTITVRDLVLNLDTKTATLAGNAVHLTGKEYAMLELMALRKNCTITKDMFLNHLYGGMDEPNVKIVDVFICKLRKKLGNGVFETVWGRGYVLRDHDVPKVGAPLVSNAVGRPMDGIDGMSHAGFAA